MQGTILTGGPIHTMANGPVESVRVDGEKITFTGELTSAQALGAAREVDLDGRCLMPGFVDAHTHPLMHGQCMSWADLSSANSVDDLIKTLREYQLGLKPDQPIRGFGYDQHRLHEGRHPTAADLDRVSNDREITIMHTSGHGYVANSVALQTAGITADTPTPPGGLIERDDVGNPIGRVFDSACDLLTGSDGVKITNHGPNFHLPESEGELLRMLDSAQDLFLAAGITSVGDCQVTEREMTTFLQARDAGRLRVRVTMYVLSSHVDAVRRLGLTSVLGDPWLSFGGIKHYADGSLLSGTAYIPCGCGTTHGYLYHGTDELEDLIATSNELGLQTATHAQGPDAIQLVLDALGRSEPRPDLRHRIEHCGFATDEQLRLMNLLGVVPVPQPTQVFRYGDGVLRDHPELAPHMYSSGRFRDAGLEVVLSSDAPVTLPDVPLACWSAETRLTSAGHVLGGDGRITRSEAFRAYTVGGAHALRRDDVGALAHGLFADLAILDRDPLEVPVDSLPDVRVDETWVNGRLAWTAGAGPINMTSDPY